MKHTFNRAKKLNKTCEITTCVSRDWPPSNHLIERDIERERERERERDGRFMFIVFLLSGGCLCYLSVTSHTKCSVAR